VPEVKDKAYPIELDLSEPLPAVLDLGAPFTLAVALVTPSGCDLTGAAFKVLQGETVVAEGVVPQIVRHDPESDDHDPRNGPLETRHIARITLIAPREIGYYQWTLLLPAQEIGGKAHAEASLNFSFRTDEHKTSLATWDVPSPVVAGERFVVKVGAKCTACCALHGQHVELRDERGSVLAVGKLGETLWPGAEGLYWTALEAVAPAAEGLCHWAIAFSAAGPELPHQGASATLSFITVGPALHQVSVAIVERETAAPIGDAQVRLGFHRSATDETGIARFTVSPGKHRLFVWKAGHAAPEQVVEVGQDLDLLVETETLPKKDPYARWLG
jgi:hypothetical protein